VKKEWPKSKLGELCQLISGQHIEAKDYNTEGRGVGYLTGPSDFGLVNPVISKWTEHPKIKAKSGDVLITVKGSGVGKINLLDKDEVAISRQLMAVRVTKADPRFIHAFLSSTFDHFQSLSTGAAIPGISREQVLGLEIPMPPPGEQKRIVGILDEAFEGIAKAKANTEKNLQNARALFESYLEGMFGERGAGWERLALEALLEKGWIESHLDGNHGSDYPRKQEFMEDGVPYISANCLDNDQVDMTLAKYLSPARAALIRKGIAKDRDVLFAHNATVGPVAILHTEENKVILGTSLTYYRCNKSRILPEYLAHYMRSSAFKTQYQAVMRQSTRNQVPITKQREFFHVIPPLEEQKDLVTQLDGILENVQLLESIYQQKLRAFEELKKSLLHEAFNGRL
jgi:type I restriction enzyme, S subunit